jgi:hypothetical protein
MFTTLLSFVAALFGVAALAGGQVKKSLKRFPR